MDKLDEMEASRCVHIHISVQYLAEETKRLPVGLGLRNTKTIGSLYFSV